MGTGRTLIKQDILSAYFTGDFHQKCWESWLPLFLFWSVTKAQRSPRVEDMVPIGLCCGPFLFPMATFSKPSAQC